MKLLFGCRFTRFRAAAARIGNLSLAGALQFAAEGVGSNRCAIIDDLRDHIEQLLRVDWFDHVAYKPGCQRALTVFRPSVPTASGRVAVGAPFRLA